MSFVPTIEIIKEMLSQFEAIKKQHEGVEAWSARALMELFHYKRWDGGFENAIKRAIEAVKVSGEDIEKHIVYLEEDTYWGPGNSGRGSRANYILTRHGSYMLMQELKISDSNLAAFAKSYFSGQTQVAENIQSRMKELSESQNERLGERNKLKTTEKDFNEVLWEHGVRGNGFGVIRSEGDRALLGLPTSAIKDRFKMKSTKPLADKAHTIVISAKQLSAAMTIRNVDYNNLRGQFLIKNEHVDNNTAIRKALESRGIFPGDLPPGEDTVILERQLTAKKRAGKIRNTPKPTLASTSNEPKQTPLFDDFQ